MQYTKIELLNEGKTKRVWSTENPRHVIVEFKDDAVVYHGKKKIFFENKGTLSNEINGILMRMLEENGVSTHYLCNYSSNESVVKRAEMIPVEVVVRNYSAGSMCERLGLAPCRKLKSPVLEFCYKNDVLRDPVINEYHAYAMELCTQEEMADMCYTVARINKILCDVMSKVGVVVADFKVEFGRVNGRLVVADEISPTTARFWDENTLAKFDKEGNCPSYDYQIILEKLRSLNG